ncbi:MAG: hypothetical protein K2L51_04950 [Clostridiales bacterium]|nr:hypothetical protein [Clostridiales bacterium]
MFCKNCGSNVDEKAVVCPHCGVQVGEMQPSKTVDRSNTIAIVGFVLSFFIALAGLICSIIGYKKAVKEGCDHKGLALAGIIISIVSMALVFLFYIIIFSAMATALNDFSLLL